MQNTLDVERGPTPTSSSGPHSFLICPFRGLTPWPCLVGERALITRLMEEETAHRPGGLAPERPLPAAPPARGSRVSEGPAADVGICTSFSNVLIRDHIWACSMCQTGIHKYHYFH